MLEYHYIILSVIVAIMIKAPNHGAFILLCGIGFDALIEFIGIDKASYGYYYSIMCVANLLVGILLHKEFKIAAFCAYLLVPVNLLGFYLWVKYYPHDLYNVICAIILTIQLLAILPKGLSNGRGRNNFKHSMDGTTGFDSGKAYDTMCERPSNKKIR